MTNPGSSVAAPRSSQTGTKTRGVREVARPYTTGLDTDSGDEIRQERGTATGRQPSEMGISARVKLFLLEGIVSLCGDGPCLVVGYGPPRIGTFFRLVPMISLGDGDRIPGWRKTKAGRPHEHFEVGSVAVLWPSQEYLWGCSGCKHPLHSIRVLAIRV